MENQPAYQISSSVNDGILEIVVTGEITASTYENVTNEVNAIITSNDAKKAIADFRAVEKRIEPSEMYRYFRSYSSILFDIKFAIVDLPENVHYKTSAINAGLSSLMWFTDVNDARKWIKSIKENNIKRYHPDYH